MFALLIGSKAFLGHAQGLFSSSPTYHPVKGLSKVARKGNGKHEAFRTNSSCGYLDFGDDGNRFTDLGCG